MEKYSAFRDPGTGLQPFLTPVAPVGSELLFNLIRPFGLLFGVVRTTLVVILLAIYLVLVVGLCTILSPIPPVHRLMTRFLTLVIARLVLFIVGVVWISVETVTRRRGRGLVNSETWNPKAGDIIVSNWVSWTEILWLAFRFNPIFVQPIFEDAPISEKAATSSNPLSYTPGRRTGTGSANISATTRAASARIPLAGFRQVCLMEAIRSVGNVPSPKSTAGALQSLEAIRFKADRPLVIFPEASTTNGRGLLRFAEVFREQRVPVKNYGVFVMCVRYDPPSPFTPSLAHSIPTAFANPFSHLFSLTAAFGTPSMSVRLLAPSESPSSQLFMVHEVVTGSVGEDLLAESCASLIAQIGKMKRTGMGWEDKTALLRLYQAKHR